jgi:Flp pilus assembly protein TadD
MIPRAKVWRWRNLAFAILAIGLAGCQTTGGQGPGADQDAARLLAKTTAAEDEARLVRDLGQALEKGELSKARILIGRLRSLRPDQPEASLGEGEMELSQGHYAAAIAAFEKLLTVEPVSARAHQGLALAFLLTGRSDAAKKHFDIALGLDPNLWRSWNGLGYYHDVYKQWVESEESYSKAFKLKPESAAVINNRGFSRLLQSQYEQAAEDFLAALRLNPKLTVARTNLQIAFAWLGKYEQALAGVSPETLPRALNNVGYVAMLRGDYSAAEAYFTRAMEASPSYDEQAAANLRRLDALKSNKNISKK